MSSSSEGSDHGAQDSLPIRAHRPNGASDDRGLAGSTPTPSVPGSVAELARQEIEYSHSASDDPFFNSYRKLAQGPDQSEPDADEDASELAPSILNQALASPRDSFSTPDDTPSFQASILSSVGSPSAPPSPASLASTRRRSPAASPRPFDRRFQSRLSSLALGTSRPSSPAFLKLHSRQSSISSQLIRPESEHDTPPAPWEVVRWTKLKKLSGQLFSEAGKRNFGKATGISIAAVIAVGTAKGIILIFDYNQTLKSIIGPGSKAVEAGAVTSLAISADHTTVAAGHASGHVFTWDLAKPARPFLHIPPVPSPQPGPRRADGHVPDMAVVHLGFLGTRHTAVVSADDRGMAFSHLATRGLGAAGRSVKTQRILGRYPNDLPTAGRARKPSTVLAFATLPLGNVSQVTDEMGLVAMLTPYLLVIVSTTPVAQTQHKAARPKDKMAHGALTGCLAWFPAVKLKAVDADAPRPTSTTKLVYCWSNILTILDVTEQKPSEASAREAPPELIFSPRTRWKGEEPIAAVQWLSRSVLGVLTITQQLLIIEDGPDALRTTDSFDLIHKHIYHHDFFSQQLQALVEPAEGEDASMRGVVADAFYQSLRAYKGRLFVLGFDDVSVGVLSNWADRLSALMDAGEVVRAIELVTSYYTGEADILTVGLPENAQARHTAVEGRLLDTVATALQQAFQDGDDQERSTMHLANACFVACLSVGASAFLFEDVFEAFEDASASGTFLEALEPYVREGQITAIPPTVMKRLIVHYSGSHLQGRLEEMICHLDPNAMDIDQITTLCKQHNLFDAFIYVWNQTIGDYLTPLIDLLSLVTDLGRSPAPQNDAAQDPEHVISALKMFPYLAFTLTSRVYPTGAEMSADVASRAKAELYAFLFSGKNVEWPKKSGTTLLTRSREESEPSFPYLRLFLEFDAPSFLGVLNEAFEDGFLNGAPDRMVNGGTTKNIGDDQIFGLSVTRQYVVSILSEVMSAADYPPSVTIYLDMFIARNLPKFPQFILLSGTALHRVIEGLCRYPSDEIAEDCQLSVEYLLSMYHPPEIDSLIPLFTNARFYRVLKSVYKADHRYAMLVRTYFADPEDQDAVYDCIGDCLRPRAGLTERQVREVKRVVQDHARDLAAIDTVRTAEVIGANAPELHEMILSSLEDDRHTQYIYLRTVLEPDSKRSQDVGGPKRPSNTSFVEAYIRLMCEYDPRHVADYIEALQSGDLRLDKVLPALEDNGVVDAAVMLMAREGQVREAIDRLTSHLSTLEAALLGLLDGAAESPDLANTQEAAADLVEALEKYTRVGIWLCQGQTKTMQGSRSMSKAAVRGSRNAKQELSIDEKLWLDLIDTIVHVTKSVSAHMPHPPPTNRDDSTPTDTQSVSTLDMASITTRLRNLVQQTFTALLNSTTAASSTPTAATASRGPPTQANHAFLRILRAFLARATLSSPSLTELRSVLGTIFSAYAYQESLLALANSLLEKDLFVHVAQIAELRQRGWRPQGQVCEICGRRVWGPGAGAKSGEQ
ncbi:MAG: Vacuolar protein sorting-associated protein 8 [Thelocarpon superellum]|nr:MAG: Vacuolar protein sorting-associated protein 8 [Thelocarpon superellum]